MIILDTNLLIYAHRSATAEHVASRHAIETAVRNRAGCGITVPSIVEFLSVVTHPAAAGGPSSADLAAAFLAALTEVGVRTMLPGPGFPVRLLRAAARLQVAGPRIFDLQIALCGVEGGAPRFGHTTKTL